METHKSEPILLVCADQVRSFDILKKLDDEGFSIVGSAPSAGIALALAAHSAPRVAILAGQTSGRRSAAELAAELTNTWGVECFVLSVEEGAEHPDHEEPASDIARAIGKALGLNRLRAA